MIKHGVSRVAEPELGILPGAWATAQIKILWLLDR